MANFSDDFDRAELGGDWVLGFGTAHDIVSGELVPQGAGVNNAMYINAATVSFSANQRAEITYGTAHSAIRPAVRMQSNGACYFARLSPTVGSDADIYEQNGSGGVAKIFDLPDTTVAAGDRVRIQIVGSLITVFKNDVEIGSTSDATLTSGQPGIVGVADGSAEDFEAGDLAITGLDPAPPFTVGQSGVKVLGIGFGS